MTEEEAKKFEEDVDKKRDEVRNRTKEERERSIEKKLKSLQPLYKRRKWNGKKRMRELVYKATPPDDYHKRQ